MGSSTIKDEVGQLGRPGAAGGKGRAMGKYKFLMNGCALWFSPDDYAYYWQTNGGAGNEVSRFYNTSREAISEMRRGKVIFSTI